jgi:hypothetical protein
MNTDQIYAYHIAHEDFAGQYILPINKLIKIYPEYKYYLDKYIGREYLQQRVVYDPDVFDRCKIDLGDKKLFWGDVSFFSIHHPQLIFEALKKLELPCRKSAKFYQIPIERFYNHSIFWVDKGKKKIDNKLNPIDCKTVRVGLQTIDKTRLPDQTLDYFHQVKVERKKNSDRNPLLFQYVPHLLATQEIFIGDCEIIEVNF